MKISLKPYRYIIFLLWLALAAGCAPSVPKLSKRAPAEVIVAFGDSLTFGTGATEAESYPVAKSSPT